jgi:hypothetical protein
MPCGDIGDNDDDVGDREPSWWFDIEPRETPDDPNTFMYKFSDVLGNAIDGLSDVIVRALVLFSSVPIALMIYATGKNPFEGGCAGGPD